MSKNQYFTPLFRIFAVSYFVYKMAFSDPNLHWTKLLELHYSSSGEMVGDIFMKIVFGLIFIAFISYQIKQGLLEFKQKTPTKNRLRLLSIIWSFLFYPLALSSLFNVNLKISNTNLTDYLFEFYTVVTIIGVIAGLVVAIKDITSLTKIKHS